VASPPTPGEPETLEQGRTPRAPSRRRRLVFICLVAALLLAAATGVGLDHRVRQREGPAVARCVEDATTSVAFANRRSDAISGYVRPALETGPPASLRRRLEGLVSTTVAPVLHDVRRARAGCARVQVRAFHDRLRTTRADCLRLLEEDLAFLRAVSAAGVRAFDARSLHAGTCVVPEPS